MRRSFVTTSLRVLTWCCVVILAVLSLLPARVMVRTGVPRVVEHFVAYAGSAAMAVGGYGASLRGISAPHLPVGVPGGTGSVGWIADLRREESG
jgi:hypothetical protein